ncbi:MAG: TylF/MycF family methyltransferase [Phycisphaerae bacterium]|nr:TylF/MycF family methyltransferase [Phycisphaerae bacterium]MDW8261499.1 TylF/MycF/NovP-related O-methyltransferase [Phycisphaerales bacterium]
MLTPVPEGRRRARGVGRMSFLRRVARQAESLGSAVRYLPIYNRFRQYTMISRRVYVANLLAAAEVADIPGCIVECGVWRGGMMAGLASVLGPDRMYYLFDSFEGLPPAREIDGPRALRWQADKESDTYHNNCAAEQKHAEKAMRMSGARRFQCIKGWFENTLPAFTPEAPIALLRIDADWYDSVLCCLENLCRHLAPGGIVQIDDYYRWDGCARAVHKFLADQQSAARIHMPYPKLAVIRGLGRPGGTGASA